MARKTGPVDCQGGKAKGNWRYFFLLVSLSGIGLALVLWGEANASPPANPRAQASEECLTCHGVPGLSLTFPSGEKMSLFVDGEAFATSVHGDKLTCSDCHLGYGAFPHPRREVQSRRDYTIAQYEVCKRCHFANYTKTLDSVHFEVLSQGNRMAPVCVDCHRAHDVTEPSQPRSRISRTCSACHQGVYTAYVNSVHGKALLDEENQDVPVCTDCHSSHNIHDPRTVSFRQETPALCVRCHASREMMDKYGISTNVLKTYLSDFHGATLTLEQKQSTRAEPAVAVCTDCHGVHNIIRVKDPNSPVIKANLLQTCRQCHPDATENFPGAWLSHYEPSLHKAPLVYLVKLFYRTFIPFVVGGLVLHVLLDLWRAATRR